MMRLLPYELQSMLLSSTLSSIPTRSPHHLLPSYFKRSIIQTKSFTSTPRRLSPEQPVLDPTLQVPPNLFESLSDAYLDVPLSSLDYPATSRTPEESLVYLLKTYKFDEALTLLRDIRKIQPIVPNIQFLKHATRLLSEGETGKEWIEWWDVSPSFKGMQISPNTVKPLEFLVDKLLQTLLQSPNHQDLSLARTIGARAAGRGFYRIVAERYLVHFAAFAPVDLGEELWQQCLKAHEQRTFIQRGYQKMEEKKRYLLKSPKGYPRWKGLSDLKVLKEKRSQMIRMHASMGRLDVAVKLVESTLHPIISKGIKIQVTTLTHLDLLTKTAFANRYNLFKIIYTHLIKERSGARRIRVAGRLLRFPSSKSITTPPPTSTALDAFYYLRNPLVHGLDVTPETTDDIQYPTFGPDAVSREYDSLIREAVEAADLEKASSYLLECIKAEVTPSLDATARYLVFARGRKEMHFFETLVRMVQSSSIGMKPQKKAYWTSALMLGHLRMKEYEEALTLFSHVFDLSGIPGQVRTQMDRRERKQTLNEKRVIPDAHTFSLAMQALVPILLEKNPSEVDAVYHSLINHQINIKPRLSLQPLPESNSNPQTPLDPYTFIPFLQAYAQQGRPPIDQLAILQDMQELGLKISKHHWGIVLGTLAKSGAPSDLVYLLRHIEYAVASSSSTLSTPSPISVSPDLIKVLPTLEIDPKLELDPALYTNIIVGLGTRGELIEAAKIREAFLGKRIQARVNRKVEMDDRMREALGRLRARERKAGGAPLGAA